MLSFHVGEIWTKFAKIPNRGTKTVNMKSLRENCHFDIFVMKTVNLESFGYKM